MKMTLNALRKPRFNLIFALAGVALLSGCGGGSHSQIMDDVPAVTVAESGHVRYMSFEGGFYALVGDDGKGYDPSNLATDFQQDGLAVKFQAQILANQNSPHLYGQPVKIIQIEKL